MLCVLDCWLALAFTNDNISAGSKKKKNAEEALRRSIFKSSPRYLYKTVDLIWRRAGDKAVDFNFYSKRALLATVLSSTTLYWLDDKSENHAKTWEFLDRRISDVMKIPKLKANFRKVVDRMLTPIAKKGRACKAT